MSAAASPPPSASREALAMKPGQRVDEYLLEQTLGGGGFGITYLARDVNLGLPVAIKEYFPADVAYRSAQGTIQALGPSTQEQFKWGLDRFIEEARTLATFVHPNIVRVLRYFATNGTAYIVMELVSGRSLKRWHPAQGGLDRASLLKLVLPLLDGLERVHQAGFLHRDIKPDNIYVRDDGSPVLIDFGSARTTDAGRDLTTIVSPGFAPFEQYHAGGRQGPWTDLYALAAVMYWLVSGVKPLDSAARLKTDDMVPALQCADPQQFGADLLAAIDWALKSDESQRPQSVAEFRDRLTGAAPSDTATTVRFAAAPARAPGAAAAELFRNELPWLENSQRSLVCSVLSIGLSGFQTRTPSQQQALKSRLLDMVAGRLKPVAPESRLGVDKPDGLGVCFMGDPEVALSVALEIQRALRDWAPQTVGMGLHLGPIRVFKDEHAHINVLGEGINTAQRIMSCEGQNRVLVSKAFYALVSHISRHGHQAFQAVGTLADRYGRQHELYEAVSASLPSGPAAPGSFPVSATAPTGALDEAQLGLVEHELLRLLGPLAPVLIRKARRNAVDIQTLREILAEHIADPAQRESFLRSGSHATVSSGASGRGPTGSGSAPAAATGHSKTPSLSVPSVVPWLAAELASKIEQHLAQAMGPMAGVLLKKELRQQRDLSSLCQALAGHIDEPRLRARFLQAVLPARKA